MAIAIEVKNLDFGYDSSQLVLQDVNFHIESGDFVSIVGPNGGGKTTLVLLLLGLLEPTRGDIRILGLPPYEARGKIGYLAQRIALDMNFPVSVLDVVRMGCADRAGFFGVFGGEDRNAAIEALAAVGMSKFAGRNFSALSGGQRQRVLIARAIAPKPEMLLMDEPAASLDVQVGSEFYELLGRLNKDMTIITVSHDMAFVSEYVKTVLCVHGRVAVHPTEKWDERMMDELYGGPVRRVRHEHNCVEKGCEGSHER
ncbi:MAG TPA: metal ABC transporter ATP-binding protein [Phycisphaerae bacterium]|nr:metal ABC transporter ATP-binding protein [Phycisphaerae bacterium]HPS52557.1 metal ABC transporter ATP-binding protein [Phycisphaerae bacterium]